MSPRLRPLVVGARAAVAAACVGRHLRLAISVYARRLFAFALWCNLPYPTGDRASGRGVLSHGRLRQGGRGARNGLQGPGRQLPIRLPRDRGTTIRATHAVISDSRE